MQDFERPPTTAVLDPGWEDPGWEERGSLAKMRQQAAAIWYCCLWNLWVLLPISYPCLLLSKCLKSNYSALYTGCQASGGIKLVFNRLFHQKISQKIIQLFSTA
jgi:hypothetical protein